MKVDPCKICGATDVNLVDGFFYCVECGTQDVNVRETIIEYSVQQDGVYARTDKKKIVTINTLKMSAEWHKWHTFNYILVGLADELVELGARPSFKVKLLWIWTKYMQVHRQQDDKGDKPVTPPIAVDDTAEDHEPEKDPAPDLPSSEALIELDQTIVDKDTETESKSNVKSGLDIKVITMAILHSMLYIALNLDGSDIQLSDLCRYIREERVSSKGCLKFVPKELKCSTIPHWINFLASKSCVSLPKRLREISMALFKKLDLGEPNVPKLSKLVEKYFAELCVPGDLKPFVFSLMKRIPIDLSLTTLEGIVRIPDYEGLAMSYILIALKICFGLDDDYEVRLSNYAETINYEQNLSKAYKFSMFLESTDRMFSFQEWSTYIEFRKQILSKYYFPISAQNRIDVDDQVFIANTMGRFKQETAIDISDDVTMGILEKLRPDRDLFQRKVVDFPASLTPLSTYTDIILTNVADLYTKELLGENFRQYSIKYVTNGTESQNVRLGTRGMSIERFDINRKATVCFKIDFIDKTSVYVRNCDNKNWLITEAPKVEHVKKSGEESDPGYASNVEGGTDKVIVMNSMESNGQHDDDQAYINCNNVLDDPDNNIFDDKFNIAEKDSYKHHDDHEENDDDNFHFEILNTNASKRMFDQQSIQDSIISDAPIFDPETFDRESAIKELIEIACSKYKITSLAPKPKPDKPLQRKRKSNLIDIVANSDHFKEPKPKKSRPAPGEVKQEVNDIIGAYYKILTREQVSLENNRNISSESEAQQLSIENINEFNAENNSDTTHNNYHTEIENEEINQNHDHQNQSQNYNTDDVIHNQENIEQVNDIAQDDDNVSDTSEEKFNPQFDENKYDIKQLYLKFNDEKIEKQNTDSDNELKKFFKKHKVKKDLEHCTKVKVSDLDKDWTTSSTSDTEVVHEDNNSLSGEDEPLNVYFENKLASQSEPERLSPLMFKSIGEPEVHNYWIRHYYHNIMGCLYVNMNSTRVFEKELTENFPKSFAWVLRLCASILETPSLHLYYELMKLEEHLVIATETTQVL